MSHDPHVLEHPNWPSALQKKRARSATPPAPPARTQALD